MTTRVIKVEISAKYCGHDRSGVDYTANPWETAELFIMLNHELFEAMRKGLVVDPSDVDYVLSNEYTHQHCYYKGGFRMFRARFYRELETTYGIKRLPHGLVFEKEAITYGKS